MQADGVVVTTQHVVLVVRNRSKFLSVSFCQMMVRGGGDDGAGVARSRPLVCLFLPHLVIILPSSLAFPVFFF